MMRFTTREYHGESWSERTIIVDTSGVDGVLIYVEGQPYLLTPAMADALAKGLESAAVVVREIRQQAENARRKL